MAFFFAVPIILAFSPPRARLIAGTATPSVTRTTDPDASARVVILGASTVASALVAIRQTRIKSDAEKDAKALRKNLELALTDAQAVASQKVELQAVAERAELDLKRIQVQAQAAAERAEAELKRAEDAVWRAKKATSQQEAKADAERKLRRGAEAARDAASQATEEKAAALSELEMAAEDLRRELAACEQGCVLSDEATSTLEREAKEAAESAAKALAEAQAARADKAAAESAATAASDARAAAESAAQAASTALEAAEAQAKAAAAEAKEAKEQLSAAAAQGGVDVDVSPAGSELRALLAEKELEVESAALASWQQAKAESSQELRTLKYELSLAEEQLAARAAAEAGSAAARDDLQRAEALLRGQSTAAESALKEREAAWAGFEARVAAETAELDKACVAASALSAAAAAIDRLNLRHATARVELAGLLAGGTPAGDGLFGWIEKAKYERTLDEANSAIRSSLSEAGRAYARLPEARAAAAAEEAQMADARAELAGKLAEAEAEVARESGCSRAALLQAREEVKALTNAARTIAALL